MLYNLNKLHAFYNSYHPVSWCTTYSFFLTSLLINIRKNDTSTTIAYILKSFYNQPQFHVDIMNYAWPPGTFVNRRLGSTSMLPYAEYFWLVWV